ncbi:hypothetical protein HMF8227_00669 [Saliniradius amylolyticus]|uniref:NIPSNAP domain-containing protein n=1 Tax=Saliniradius amylolyticus TaxID=2183582 RepID=A0A2S2E0I5_9ALTE|nr:hypothetical protein [Saliniradius amylolyticus]AWL11165.1 hypothetical protein HMF8227_00669 [Saliniradius amylolyticus]
MKTTIFALGLLLLCGTATANAQQLEVYKDYEPGSQIIMMTTVKVDPNMTDLYLAGIRDTWVKAVRMQKEMGYIKDWKILSSDLPLAGDFNLVLMVTFEKASDLEPNKERYQAFMKQWGEANRKRSEELVKTYPEVRTLTGEYRLREVMMK